MLVCSPEPSHQLPCAGLVPADTLEWFTFLFLPQPPGEMLADGHEGVGFVVGIGNDLMKPSHLLLSGERKITHECSVPHAKGTGQIRTELIKQWDSVRVILSVNL